MAFALAPAAHARAVRVAPLARPFVIRVTDQGGGFSVDLPIVGRVHGVSTTFFTALDITNNTAQPTGVDFFYTPADGSATRSGSFGTLNGFDDIHTDDFLQSLVDSGVIAANQADLHTGEPQLGDESAVYRVELGGLLRRVFREHLDGGTLGPATD